MNLDFEVIKEKLLLTEPLSNIDDDLLALAFIHPSGSSSLDRDTRIRLKRKYGWQNYEILEKQGDRVLGLIATMITTRLTRDVGLASEMESNITCNSALNKFMYDMGLVGYIVHSGKQGFKMVADVFEAIIGALYNHLITNGADRDYISILHDWFFNLPVISDKIANMDRQRFLFQPGKTLDDWYFHVSSYMDLSDDLREELMILYKSHDGRLISKLAEQLIIHKDFPIHQSIYLLYPTKDYGEILDKLPDLIQNPGRFQKHIFLKAFRSLAQGIPDSFEKRYRGYVEYAIRCPNRDQPHVIEIGDELEILDILPDNVYD